MRQLSCRPCGQNGGDELVAGQILIATEVHYNIRNPEGGGGDNEAEEEKGAEVRWGQIQSMVRPSEDCHSTSHNYADSHTSQ